MKKIIFGLLLLVSFSVIADDEVQGFSIVVGDDGYIGRPIGPIIRLREIATKVTGMKTCGAFQKKLVNVPGQIEINPYVVPGPIIVYNNSDDFTKIPPIYTPKKGARIKFDVFNDVFMGISTITKVKKSSIRTDFFGTGVYGQGAVTGFVNYNYNTGTYVKVGGTISVFDSTTGCFFGGKFK